MSASDPLEDYPLSYQEFYSEIPGSTDYLNDIDPNISDEHDLQMSSNGGLSAEQVSEIARDSLSATAPSSQNETSAPELFPPDSQAGSTPHSS